MTETQGERIRKLRKHLRMNQEDFAESIHITQGAISQIEKSGNASNEIILKISNAHNVSLDWLMRGSGEMLQQSKPDQKNIAPTMSSENFWREMALSQQKTALLQQQTIADLAKALNFANEKIFNLLSGETVSSTPKANTPKQ